MKDLRARAAACGVEVGYHDHRGTWREAPERTLELILETLEPQIEAPFPPGAARRSGAAPRCFLPDDLRGWGWATQVYSLRSAASWGMGDLGDLGALARLAAREHGASFLMINPLGAATPAERMQPSPYFPGSRIFRNPVYLSIDALNDPSSHVDALRVRGQRLNAGAQIDRDRVWELKRPALQDHFERFTGNASFDAYLAEHGTLLRDFATFTAIAEQHGTDWRRWPDELSSPRASGVESYRRAHRDAVRFHEYLQWLLDRQLAGVTSEIDLINDLPVGVDPAGADAWMYRGAFAEGFSAGAPPDDFNRSGQEWGAAPFHPARLAALDYDPFIQTIRAGLRHAAGLRIDHVMGLFRLFWIPEGCAPTEGAYVRYPAGPLLEILARESRAARALVIGEDLGTVEEGVRETLAERSILSYRLLVFEPFLASIPTGSLAAATTHDLPTLAGIWTGSDLQDQLQAGVAATPDVLQQMRRRLAEVAGATPDAQATEVVRAVYGCLAATGARLVAATLEDAAGQLRRPNMPGTRETWPNWCIPLPMTLEQIRSSGSVRDLARALSAPDRGAAAPPSGR